jgi:FAD/FMN-containing dehydrogenase
MITRKDFTILSGIVSDERISIEESRLFRYSRDLGNSIPDELLKTYNTVGAELVALPKTTEEEVSAILDYAYENDIPVTTRGDGPWALGGVLPMDGGWDLPSGN